MRNHQHDRSEDNRPLVKLSDMPLTKGRHTTFFIVLAFFHNSYF
uniref:Uncharacterized protein n=1 Tax=Siphoviridae sp. ctKwY15 TaxID=2827843 RepID=A0A8S5SUQ9_9CAUD|nr:MAG TPA: hypothetical protein [Siphoviridae sp. ctKwY15]